MTFTDDRSARKANQHQEIGVGPQMTPADSLPSTGGGEAEAFTCSIGQSCGDEPTDEAQRQGIKCVAVRCKSGLCPKCGGSRAWNISDRLLDVLKTMQSPQMWTLTVNPDVGGPREVYDHLKKVRAVAEFVRSMWNRGYLRSRDYFCAVEYQTGKRCKDGKEGTGQVHFHVLLDSKTRGIPHAVAHERWQMFRPEWAGEIKEGRPGLGFVQFEPIDNREGMSKYFCKYMTEGTKKGFPQWVLDRANETKPNGSAKYKAVAYTVSKGFWQRGLSSSDGTPDVQQSGGVPCKVVKPAKVKSYSRGFRPLDERLAGCCVDAVLLDVRVIPVLGGTRKKYKYLGKVPNGWKSVVDTLGLDDKVAKKSTLWLRKGEELLFCPELGIKPVQSGTTLTDEHKNGVKTAVERWKASGRNESPAEIARRRKESYEFFKERGEIERQKERERRNRSERKQAKGAATSVCVSYGSGSDRMVGCARGEARQVPELDDRPSLRVMEAASGVRSASETEEAKGVSDVSEHLQAGMCGVRVRTRHGEGDAGSSEVGPWMVAQCGVHSGKPRSVDAEEVTSPAGRSAKGKPQGGENREGGGPSEESGGLVVLGSEPSSLVSPSPGASEDGEDTRNHGAGFGESEAKSGRRDSTGSQFRNHS